MGECKRNAMQLIFGVYNIQGRAYHEPEELKQKWEAIARQMGINKTFKQIPAPVLTRWWFVGVAACMLLEDWEVWQKFMVVTRNDPLSFGKAVNNIASSNISLMAEPMIKSDLLLISTFHTFFMFPHFKFLQGGDEQSKRCGYQTKHLLERYFLMHKVLKNNTNKQWPQNTHFNGFM